MTDKAIINALLAQVEIKRQQEADQRRHLRLGELIDKLTGTDQSKPCVITGVWTARPGSVDSYRGYYSDLAIDFGDTDIQVSEVVKMLTRAVYSEYEGYKGGHYLMDRDTLVWIASYGDATGIGAVDVVEDAEQVSIVSASVESA